MKVFVECDVCLRQAESVRVKGSPSPPATWCAIAPICCPEEWVTLCDNPACRQHAAEQIYREHEQGDQLLFKQTVRAQRSIEALERAIGVTEEKEHG